MNVTDVPEQIVVKLADIITLTGRFGLTVIVIVFDVAGFPVAQVALDVKTHVTKSALAKELLEYVVEFVPTFAPFNFH